jgi:hypothetical protein
MSDSPERQEPSRKDQIKEHEDPIREPTAKGSGLNARRAAAIGAALTVAAVLGKRAVDSERKGTAKPVEPETRETRRVETSVSTAGTASPDARVLEAQRSLPSVEDRIAWIRANYTAGDSFDSGFSATLRFFMEDAVAKHRLDEVELYLKQFGKGTKRLALRDVAFDIARQGDSVNAIKYAERIEDPFIREEARRQVSAYLVHAAEYARQGKTR